MQSSLSTKVSLGTEESGRRREVMKLVLISGVQFFYFEKSAFCSLEISDANGNRGQRHAEPVKFSDLLH